MEAKEGNLEKKVLEEEKIKSKDEAQQQKVSTQPAQFSSLKPQVKTPGTNNIELLFDVPVELTAEIGRTAMTVKEVLGLGPGSLVELNRLAGEPAELLINGKLVARGEVVVVDENFGIRITEIIESEARLRKLQ